MKNVILIGDSIRLGYQPTVQKELAGKTDVWGPEDNGGTSRNVLAHLKEWVIARRPEIVHLNCGLHDLRKEFGSTESEVPLDEYRANLEKIFRQIRDHTSARIIWATTTPVNEGWHHENKPFDRFEADVLAYNRQAQEAAAQFGAEINDLFEVVARAGRDRYLLPDGVHFTAAGYTLLGQTVVSHIRKGEKNDIHDPAPACAHCAEQRNARPCAL